MQELPAIPQRASLKEWQTYVGRVVKARGWDKASDLETFLLFQEEVGELAKAMRKHRGLFSEGPPTDAKASKKELALEMADVLSYLLDLAERFHIDLEAAAVEKEEINRHRHWD